MFDEVPLKTGYTFTTLSGSEGNPFVGQIRAIGYFTSQNWFNRWNTVDNFEGFGQRHSKYTLMLPSSFTFGFRKNQEKASAMIEFPESPEADRDTKGVADSAKEANRRRLGIAPLEKKHAKKTVKVLHSPNFCRTCFFSKQKCLILRVANLHEFFRASQFLFKNLVFKKSFIR